MKGNLEFDLTEIDDDLEMKRCLKSLDMIKAISDIDDILRGNRENENPDILDYERFQDILYSRGIIIDDLII